MHVNMHSQGFVTLYAGIGHIFQVLIVVTPFCSVTEADAALSQFPMALSFTYPRLWLL